jgi:phosphate:Na+ symporter
MVLLNIAGGVALILFGIRFLRKGLERMFGHGLYAWIERMARRPWSMVMSGSVVGAVAPSSTAQTLISLQLLSSTEIPAERVLIFLLGANIGITAMVQLIAFHFFDYYPVFLIVGLVGFQFCRSEPIRGVGQTFLGLGFIYLAMSIMSGAARDLTRDADFNTVFGVLLHYRILLVFFAAILTFTTQSSTAAIGLALALGEAGAGALNLLIPVVLGANLGIGFNSLVAGWSTPAGRRLAASNLVLKGAAIGLALAAFGPLEALLMRTPGSIARQAADFHTGFNVIVAAVGIVFGGPLSRLVERALFSTPEGDAAAVGVIPVSTHLDPEALGSPVFALANAARETLRLADEVKGMFEGAWRALNEHDAALAREVQKHDDRIDELNASIKLYLSRIPSDAMTPRDNQLQFGLLNFCSQLEAVGDIIDKNICSAVIKHGAKELFLHPNDQAALQTLYGKVLRRMDAAISVLATRDRALARQFLHDGDRLKEWCIEVQKSHYQRLTEAQDAQAAEASKAFLDLVNVLRRISGQLSTIGHTFATGKIKTGGPVDPDATEYKTEG